MSKKQQQTWTPYFNVHDIFEIYPNINPKTRAVIFEDGSQGEKMPDGGVRLRFLNEVPSWYAKRNGSRIDETADFVKLLSCQCPHRSLK